MKKILIALVLLSFLACNKEDRVVPCGSIISKEFLYVNVGFQVKSKPVKYEIVYFFKIKKDNSILEIKVSKDDYNKYNLEDVYCIE